MNWLDVILATILLVSLIHGFRAGFSRQIIGLLSGVAALLLGLWTYGMAGGWLEPYLSSPALAHCVRLRDRVLRSSDTGCCHHIFCG